MDSEFKKYIENPELYLSKFNQDNKYIKDLFKKLFLLSYERMNPIYIEDKKLLDRQYTLHEENKTKVLELSKKLGMDEKETQMLFYERSIVEGFFKDVLDVKTYITKDHEKIRNLLIDIFSCIRHSISCTKRLKDLYSLTDKEIEELLKGIEFNSIEDLLPETPKAVFFNNVFEYFKRKGNAYFFKDILKYFIYSHSVGILNEWWLVYDGGNKNTASKTDFKFVSKPIWNPKEYYYDYPEVSIPYHSLIENDPHWYYDKEGNPSICKIYSQSEDNFLPSLTSYLSFNYFVIESHIIKDLSVFYKRINEYNKFFFIHTLKELDPIDSTNIKNVFIKEDKTDNLIILNNNNNFFKMTINPLEYIRINNEIYSMSLDEKIIKLSREFIDFIPDEYKIKRDKRSLSKEDSTYNNLTLNILKTLRLIYCKTLETYTSELELFYLIHFLNRGKIFHKYNFIGKFDNFDLKFSSGYEEGDYIEYNNKHYIYHNFKWWELYFPVYDLKEQKEKLLSSRSIVFLRELEIDRKTETNVITEYNPNRIFTFLNIDPYDSLFSITLKRYFPQIDLSCFAYEKYEMLRTILPYNIFCTRNYINEEYNNISKISIPTFIKRFLLKNYWTLGECISDEDMTEFLDSSTFDYRNISFSSFNESILKILQEISLKKFLDRFFIFPNDNENIFTDFKKCVTYERNISDSINIDYEKEEITYKVKYNNILKGVVFIEADPSLSYISGSEDTVFSFLSNIEFKFDVVLENPITFVTFRIYFIYENINDRTKYIDIHIYDSTTITIDTRTIKKIKSNINTLYIQKIGIELINFETKKPSNIKIKNIKINLTKNITSCKEIINRFEKGFKITRIPDTAEDSTQNLTIYRPSSISSPKIILPQKQLIVKDRKDILEDELYNTVYTELFHKGYLFSDIQENKILKNKIEFCALFSKNIPAKPFIFFIFLPKDYIEIRNIEEYKDKENIVRFSFFYSPIGLFNNLVDLEVMGFGININETDNTYIQVSSFDELVDLCYNKSDKYFKLVISNPGKYYTFFDYSKVNIIGFKFTPKESVDKEYEHCFLYATLEDFKIDRDIVLSERKFPSDLAYHDIEILRLLNYDLVEKVKEKIESFYIDSDKLYNYFESFKEMLYNDLFDFYKDNDLGISSRIREMPNLITNNFQLKKCIKLLKQFKPIHSKLLPPLFFYEKEERIQNKINLRQRMWIKYKHIEKEKKLNINDKILTNEIISIRENKVDKLDSFKRNIDDIIFINKKYIFDYIEDSSRITEFIEFPKKFNKIDKEPLEKTLSINNQINDFYIYINNIYDNLDTTIFEYNVSYPYINGINIIHDNTLEIPITDLTSYIQPNIEIKENLISINTYNIEKEIHFMISFTNESILYKILLDKENNNNIKIINMKPNIENSNYILDNIFIDSTIYYYPNNITTTNNIFITNLIDYTTNNDSSSLIERPKIEIVNGENIISSNKKYMLIGRPVSGILFKLYPNEKIEFINTIIKTLI